MNKEWLGLIIPLAFLLFFTVYFSVLPAIYGDEEYPGFLKKPLDLLGNVGTGRITTLYLVLMLPVVLCGFLLGVFQAKTSNNGLKWFGHVLGVLGLLLAYGVYRFVS
jgi:hypothetical protein